MSSYRSFCFFLCQILRINPLKYIFGKKINFSFILRYLSLEDFHTLGVTAIMLFEEIMPNSYDQQFSEIKLRCDLLVAVKYGNEAGLGEPAPTLNLRSVLHSVAALTALPSLFCSPLCLASKWCLSCLFFSIQLLFFTVYHTDI